MNFQILDWILGEEVVSYDRNRLIELIRMSNEDGQLQDELRIAVGAMEMNDKTVANVMTKIDVSLKFSNFEYLYSYIF